MKENSRKRVSESEGECVCVSYKWEIVNNFPPKTVLIALSIPRNILHSIFFYWEDQPVWIGGRLTLSLEDIFQIAYYRIIVKYRRIPWWKLPRKIYKFITKTHSTHIQFDNSNKSKYALHTNTPGKF